MAISWDCPRCKLMNPLTYKECSRCHGPRPDGIEPKPYDWWKCPRCNHTNVPTSTSCTLCHVPRNGQSEPKPTKPPPRPIPELPSKPPVPAKPAQWKKVCASLAGVLGVVIIGVKLFAPGWIVLTLEMLRQLLSVLGG